MIVSPCILDKVYRRYRHNSAINCFNLVSAIFEVVLNVDEPGAGINITFLGLPKL